jgi:glycosyltransferase involved in cell wall biosynthesis
MPIPRVTVAIPTYNRVELLQRAVRSVLDQTLTDVEVIIHDNCSTDGTEAWARQLSAREDRVIYVRNIENIGHWRNQTKALHSGMGPYVSLMWDDDVMLPTNLERKVAVLDMRPDVVAVHSSFENVRTDGTHISTWIQWDMPDEEIVVERPDEFIAKAYRFPARMHIGTIMFRRSAVGGMGLFQQDAPADDLMVFLRMARRGSIAYVREPLMQIEINTGISATTGYLAVIGEHYAPTFKTIDGANKVLDAFMSELRPGFWRRMRLRINQRTYAQSMFTEMMMTRHRGFRPPRQAWTLLRQIARAHPLVVVNPKFYVRSMFGRPRGLKIDGPPNIG